MVNIYITVGATVPFDALVQQLINNLNLLITNAIQTFHDSTTNTPETVNIVFQYGNNYSDRFESLLNTYLAKQSDFIADLSSKNINPTSKTSQESVFELLETNTILHTFLHTTTIKSKVTICGFALSNNIPAFLHAYLPELFITHAGTGSLLDALRLSSPKLSSSKRVVVLCVVNNKLMDNHQLDIAQKFAMLNLVTCVESPNYLKEYLEKLADIVRDTTHDNLQMGFNAKFKDEVLLGNW
ncbi:hypothetical protein ACO0RG_002375 [Hanseniaspora osmophila]